MTWAMSYDGAMTPANLNLIEFDGVFDREESNLPDIPTESKIVLIAKVTAPLISENTYNYITCTNFPEMPKLKAKNISPPTFLS